MYKRDIVMFDLVSLTVGISRFPTGHRLSGDIDFFRQLRLGQVVLGSEFQEKFLGFHNDHHLSVSIPCFWCPAKQRAVAKKRLAFFRRSVADISRMW